jgi:pyrimidine operon attenuation protein/uracil phosphoribosyltransferase
MQVLTQSQIHQKITRLAYEILEQNLNEDVLVLAGINNNGFRFATLLHAALSSISNRDCILAQIRLNPANPLENLPETDLDAATLEKASVIIVDDVANTGRTIFYAFQVCMPVLVRKLQVAVLVDRKHKRYPIQVDYVGLSLATTMGEHIEANLADQHNMTVTLH